VPDIEGSGLSLVQHSNSGYSSTIRTQIEIENLIAEAKHNVIEFPDLRLSVKPFNARLVSTFNTWFLFIPLPVTITYPEFERFRKNDQSASPPFIIEIAFYPQTGDLSVDPSQIVLSLTGRNYKAARMIMPSAFTPMHYFGGHFYQGLSLCFLPYNVQLEKSLKPLQPIQISAGEKACISLSFDIAPPVPETEYSVSISGVEMAGKGIQIPTIRFVKGIAYYNDSIP